MLVLAPSPELLAKLLPLLISEEPAIVEAVESLKLFLMRRPGEPIPHTLVARAIAGADDLALGHPAVADAVNLAEHLKANPPTQAPPAGPTAPATPSSAADASPAGGAATPTAAEASAMGSLAKAAASLTTAVSLAEAASRRGPDASTAGSPA